MTRCTVRVREWLLVVCYLVGRRCCAGGGLVRRAPAHTCLLARACLPRQRRIPGCNTRQAHVARVCCLYTWCFGLRAGVACQCVPRAGCVGRNPTSLVCTQRCTAVLVRAVGNLPYDWGETEVRRVMSEVGPVLHVQYVVPRVVTPRRMHVLTHKRWVLRRTRASIVTNRETGGSAGYAFCRYADASVAQSAMKHLDGYQLDNGRRLRVAPPNKEGGGGGSSRGGGADRDAGVRRWRWGGCLFNSWVLVCLHACSPGTTAARPRAGRRRQRILQGHGRAVPVPTVASDETNKGTHGLRGGTRATVPPPDDLAPAPALVYRTSSRTTRTGLGSCCSTYRSWHRLCCTDKCC